MMARQYRFHLIGLVLGLTLLVVLVTSEVPEFPLVKRTVGQEGVLLPQGTPAPDFLLPTVQGQTLSLEQLRGSPAVLVFTSATCGACDALKEELLKLESADLQSFLVFMQGEDDPQVLSSEVPSATCEACEEPKMEQLKLKKDDPQVLSSEMQQLEGQIGERFLVAQDTAKSAFGAYKISVVPTAYQIDEEGKIRASAIGVSRSLELVKEVEIKILSIPRPAGKE